MRKCREEKKFGNDVPQWRHKLQATTAKRFSSTKRGLSALPANEEAGPNQQGQGG